METVEFVRLRKRINKTQKEMAQLLGVSVKTIHSYEQGWRSIPAHIERQFFFLLSRKINNTDDCWIIMNCPAERKRKCPAWEFNSGKVCWFINGTMWGGKIRANWAEKMRYCRQCRVLKLIL